MNRHGERYALIAGSPPEVRDGTTNQPVFVGGSDDDGPAVFSSNGRRAQVEAMKLSGVEEYDIPAFLRKQAD